MSQQFNKADRVLLINKKLKELSELESQLIFSVETNLKSKEYAFLRKAASRLKDLQLEVEDLVIEKKSLIEAIEDEAKEVLS